MFDYWETKDGKRIQVIDMETSHIESCIKGIENGKINFEIGGTFLGDIVNFLTI